MKDILDIALAQRIGGADGELIDALCSEISRLRNREAVAWMVDDSITVREDFAATLGWNGAFVGIGRAIPNAWTPMLYSAMASPTVSTIASPHLLQDRSRQRKSEARHCKRYFGVNHLPPNAELRGGGH